MTKAMLMRLFRETAHILRLLAFVIMFLLSVLYIRGLTVENNLEVSIDETYNTKPEQKNEIAQYK